MRAGCRGKHWLCHSPTHRRCWRRAVTQGQPSSTAAAEDESKHAPTAGATAGSASSQPQAPAQPVPATVFMPSESLVATLLSQRIATAPVPAAGVDMVMVTAPPKVSGRLAEVLAETDVLSGVYEGTWTRVVPTCA